MNTLTKAIDFAARMHRKQRRKNHAADPYINYPIAVMNILGELGVTDCNVLSAAVLHDVVEDTECTEEVLREHFNEVICNLVMEVSDDKSLPKAERKKLQVKNVVDKSPGAKLIQLADKLHNMTSLVDGPPATWLPEYTQGYFVWCKAVVDRIEPFDQVAEALLNRFERFHKEDFAYNGMYVPCFPKDCSWDEILEEHYASME